MKEYTPSVDVLKAYERALKRQKIIRKNLIEEVLTYKTGETGRGKKLDKDENSNTVMTGRGIKKEIKKHILN